MQNYIGKDKVVDKKFVNKVIKSSNEACKSLVRIVGIGKNSGQGDRAVSNVHVANDCELPVYSGLPKDHKIGRKYRPLVNGNTGPLANLSELTSDILKPFLEELKVKVLADNVCKSTEELLYQFEKYNNRQDIEGERCIASMDIESLYPSLKTEDTIMEIKEVILNSDNKIEGLDIKEIGIFLRKNMTTKEIEDKDLAKFVPSKLKNNKNLKNKDNLWKFPDLEVNEMDKKVLLSETLAIVIRLLMNNHIYKFNNEIRVQIDEGSIGMTYVGIVAEIKVIKWNLKLKEKLETLKIANEIHSTFVDDITLAPEIIKPGMKLEDGKLVHCKVKENNDNSIPGDMRTMLLITEIANRIDPIIKVTFDVASNYDDNMVPILDVKVGLNKDGKIVYKFYRKPIASKLLTHGNSAMSMNKKMEIVTQECFKRLHNTSDLMDSETKICLLTEFMRDLKSSGYNESERETVLEGGIKTYANLKSKAEKGIRPFFRSNSYEKEKRMKEKKDKRDNWYKSKNDSESMYKTVMYVEATPGDELLKMLRETEEKFKISDNHRIKFISKSGMKLGQMLQRKDPFLKVCDCKPSINAFEKTGKIIDCKKNNVHYEAACRKCNENGIVRKYDGETARNIHTRSKEHYDNLKNKSEKSWMLRHVLNEHKEDSESLIGKLLENLQNP